MYNNEYGVLPDKRVDKIIASEIASEDNPVEIDSSSINPQYSTEETKPESGTFLAEDWVQPEPKISYKYMDDSKFYTEDELPENKFRTGNVIAKAPESTENSILYSRN